MYTKLKPQVNGRYCSRCASQPCECRAINDSQARHAKLAKPRTVSTCGAINATYRAGLRTGELAIAPAPCHTVELVRQGKRKR